MYELREGLGASLRWYLCYDGATPFSAGRGGGWALSRSLPDAPRWSTELSTQAGGWGAELTFHIWEKPDEKNHGWDRWKGLRRYWGSNTVTGAVPAALGKPISRERSRSRWPKKTVCDNGSG